MIELNERPVRQNQLAAKLILIFFALAAAMAATLMFHIGPKLPLQVLFLLFSGFGVFVWYRAYYIVYYYVLTGEYGAPQLIIIQQNGKRRSTVCRLRVDEIQKIRNKYLLKFYLRPKYLIKKMLYCVHNPIILKNYIKHGIKLLNTIFRRK
jgi:hypothetical protein